MTQRIVPLLLTWVVLIFGTSHFLGGATLLFELRLVALMLALPWVFVAIGASPSEALDALRDAFASASSDLPAERRQRSAALLHAAGSATFATGLIALFLALFGAMHTAAQIGGNSQQAVLAGFGGMVLGPLYGLALRSFLYEPLASRLEGDASTLADELGD